MPFRVGLGHDTHRLIAGRPLILGGVRIEHDLGLDGHSDADVLLHAITDALLGAAGLGDIANCFRTPTRSGTTPTPPSLSARPSDDSLNAAGRSSTSTARS